MNSTELPIIDEMYVLASLSHDKNVSGVSNKFWNIKVFDLGGGSYKMVVHFGKVDTAGQSREKIISNLNDAHRKIAEQIRGGYRKIERQSQKVDVVIEDDNGDAKQKIAPSIYSFVTSILSDTNQNIASYLNVSVSDLSLAQITHGRQVISQLNTAKNGNDKDNIRRLVEEYLTTIPTKTDRYEADYIIRQIIDDLDKQESRLNQLEAAVLVQNQSGGQTIKVKNDLFSKLGAEIIEPRNDKEVSEIVDAFEATKYGLRYKLVHIFEVVNPNIHTKYEKNDFGKIAEGFFFHGTKPEYFRHIANQGLRLPTTSGNGKLFGYGIYFADQSAKARTYANYGCFNGNQHTMLVSKVAFGKKYVTTENNSWHKIPYDGYHSLYAEKEKNIRGAFRGYLAYNELIVYREEQANLNYVIVYEE